MSELERKDAKIARLQAVIDGLNERCAIYERQAQALDAALGQFIAAMKDKTECPLCRYGGFWPPDDEALRRFYRDL